MLTLWACIASCDVVPFDQVRVKSSAVLYSSAELCHSRRVAAASQVIVPGQIGVVEAGTTLKVTRQDASKESLCMRVQYQGRDGFLLAHSTTTEWVRP